MTATACIYLHTGLYILTVLLLWTYVPLLDLLGMYVKLTRSTYLLVETIIILDTINSKNVPWCE